MDNRIVMISIAAVIGIIVLGSVLMPILDDATTTEDTFTNEGLWRMKVLENGDTYSLSSGAWSYNGDEIIPSATASANANSNVVVGDTWLVRATGGVRGNNMSGNSTNTVVVGNNDEVTFTGSGMSGTTTQTLTGYGASTDGDYVMTSYTQSAYLKGDSEVYATGVSIKNNDYVVVHITGSIDDGFTVTAAGMYWPGDPTYSNFTITNVVADYTPVSGHEDLYQLNKITADLSYTVTPTGGADPYTSSMSVTYSSYVVPYEVTAERSVQFTPGQNAIFAAIPVMIILAVLLGVVALVIRSRMD